MKRYIFITILSGILALSNAQQSFTVPEITNEDKIEVLYMHTISYCASGISLAKSKGMSAKKYGEYIGEQFKPFWNPADGFPMLVNRIVFILAAMHPQNEMKITEQSENMISFKMKNLDMMFKEGDFLGVSYEDFLSCSEGILTTLSEYMGCSFHQETNEAGWYLVTLRTQK